MDIENKVVDAFVIRRKKERAIFELSNPEKRERFISRIEDYFDTRYVSQIDGHVATYQDLYRVLKVHGAPEMCYVMGIYEPNYDGKIINLKEALTICFRGGPVLLSCIHGKLAYYEAHPQCVVSPRYIMSHK